MVALHNTPRHSRESDYVGFLGKKKNYQSGLRSILSRRLYFGMSCKISNFILHDPIHDPWSDPWSGSWSNMQTQVILGRFRTFYKSFKVILGRFRSF